MLVFHLLSNICNVLYCRAQFLNILLGLLPAVGHPLFGNALQFALATVLLLPLSFQPWFAVYKCFFAS